MRRTRLPLATKSAKGRSVALTAEELINAYVEQADPGSRSAAALIGRPGNTLFSQINDDLIRGVHWVPSNGTLWVICGLRLFKVSRNGAPTQIGTIGGYGRVSLADNGVELCITTEAITYVVTLATDTLTAVTDSDFPNADTVAFLGGYFFFNNNQSGTEGQLFWSSLYGGSTYDALDFATAENSPDNLVAVWRDHDRLLLFGDDTIESWFLTGDDTIVAPYKGSVINRGLGARWSVANVDNSVLFLDDNGIVRRIGGQGGYSAERISTHAIEYEIATGAWRHNDSQAYDGAVASTYIEEGHEFYLLTVPGLATFVYDAATRVWHKRRHRNKATMSTSFHLNAFDKIICGSIDSGDLYEQKLSFYDDDGEEYVTEIQFPAITMMNARFRVHEIEVVAETGPEGYYSNSVVTSGFELGEWAQQADGFTEWYREVGYGNGVFMVSGGTGGVDNILIRSTDNGVTWAQVVDNFGSSSAIYEVLYDPYYEKWFSCGEDGYIGTSSDDGVTWSTVQSGSERYISAGFNNGTWLLSGSNGRMVRSTDGGGSWSTVTTGSSENFTRVSHNAGRWIVTGTNGIVRTSTDDGLSWSALAAAEALTGSDGTKSNQANSSGTWIIVGDNGMILRSPDNGVTWATITSPFGASDNNEIFYGIGLWVITSENGKIGHSEDDGLTWTLVNDSSFTSSDTISGLGFGNNTFLACSPSGKIATMDAEQLTSVFGAQANYLDTPYMMLDVSNCGSREPDVTQPWQSLGKQGDHCRRMIWRRLGQHRTFTPKVAISAPVKRVIIEATARVTADG